MDPPDIQSITLEGHSDYVRSVAFSPSGQLVASGSYDTTIRLWSAQSGDQITVLQGHRGCVWSVAFSPDGATIASGSDDRTIKLWTVASRSEIATLDVHSPVYSVVFSPDSTLLASGSRDNSVKKWDVESRTCIKTMRRHRELVFCVAFSPDGKTLASGSTDSTIRLWEVVSGACIGTLHRHQSDVNSVDFSLARDLLASSSDDKTIILWDIAAKIPVATLLGHTDWVTSTTFSPNGESLASASQDKTVRLWNIASRSLCATLQGHSNRVYSVTFSPDGTQLASASDDKTIRLWRLSDQSIANIPTSPSDQDDATPLLSSTLRLNNDITSLISLAGSVIIGSGGFGEVVSATHRDRGKVALKRAQKFFDDASARRFLREVDLWRSVSHPHILTCLGMCEFDALVYVVSPFIENGDLRFCMARQVPFNRSKILYEVAEALTHLHSRGVIHGDVKAQNILLSNDRSALLCDFGLAKVLDSTTTSTMSKGAGSVRWMAPELFDDEPRSMASDVYSFGITIAEVLSGETPYPRITNNFAVPRHVDSGGRPQKVPSQSPEGKSYSVLWDTAEKCWVQEAKDRPYMVQVLAMLFPLTGEKI